MGVIGYSVTGKAALEQGTSATGVPLDHAPRHTAVSDSNPAADNWVAFHDTYEGFGIILERLRGCSRGTLHCATPHALHVVLYFVAIKKPPKKTSGCGLALANPVV